VGGLYRSYKDEKLERILEQFGIKKIEVSQSELDQAVYKEVLKSIKTEWDKKLHPV